MRVALIMSLAALLVFSGSAQADPVDVAPTGDAHADHVAVSGTGAAEACGDGEEPCAAVSGTGDARGCHGWWSMGCTAVSGTGNATCGGRWGPTTCVAVSGTGDATSCYSGVHVACVAVSGTGNASCGGPFGLACIGVSGTGRGGGYPLGVSGGGPSACVTLVVGVCAGWDECIMAACVGGDGVHECALGACAGTADAEASAVAVSLFGNATCWGWQWCVTLSGTGDAGCDHSAACVAASTAGRAECRGDPCVSVSGRDGTSVDVGRVHADDAPSARLLIVHVTPEPGVHAWPGFGTALTVTPNEQRVCYGTRCVGA